MKENREYSTHVKIQWFFIFLSIVFVIISVSAATENQFIIYSVSNFDYQYTVDATNDNNIIFRDNHKGIVPWSYNVGRNIKSIAISPDGKYITAGCDGGLIFLFNQDGVLLWKKTFGNAAIRSLSFSQGSNYIDASNVMNQAFYISRNGNLAGLPTTSAATPIPSTPDPLTLASTEGAHGNGNLAGLPSTSAATPILSTPDPSIQKTLESPDSISEKNEPSEFLGFNYILGIIALFGLLILGFFFFKNHKKTETTQPCQPPPSITGEISVISKPAGARIFIDGGYIGISPLMISNVTPSIHIVRAEFDSYYSEIKMMSISAGKTFVFAPSLQIIPLPTDL